mmetsp:Transcript_23338/g.40717  ORF Transcript_23338/g.40717 Transcript_23338/m.40717 type:complete len:145 (-) Transcript_23338:197-631(-)
MDGFIGGEADFRSLASGTCGDEGFEEGSEVAAALALPSPLASPSSQGNTGEHTGCPPRPSQIGGNPSLAPFRSAADFAFRPPVSPALALPIRISDPSPRLNPRRPPLPPHSDRAESGGSSVSDRREERAEFGTTSVSLASEVPE